MRFLLPFLFIIVACHPEGNQTQVKGLSQIQDNGFVLELKEDASFSNSKREIIERARASKRLDIAPLMESFIASQREEIVKRLPEIESELYESYLIFDGVKDFLKERTASNWNPAQLKRNAVLYLEEGFNQELVYNKDFTTLFDVPLFQRHDSFSGTALFLVFARDYYGEIQFPQKNLVVIYTDGHIKPGYLTKEEGDWLLHSIETTVRGEGYSFEGRASQYKEGIVIEATHFLLMQILKDDLKKSSALAEQMKEFSREKYGFLNIVDNSSHNLLGNINTDPFIFGQSKTLNGDIAMSEIDVIKEKSELKAKGNQTPNSSAANLQTESDLIIELNRNLETPQEFLRVYFESSVGNISRDNKESWYCVKKIISPESGKTAYKKFNKKLNLETAYIDIETFDFRFQAYLKDGSECSNSYLDGLYERRNLEKIFYPEDE